MTAIETLAAITQLGATIEWTGDKLRCTAPTGALTSELRSALRENRDSIVEALAVPKVSPDAESRRKSESVLSAHLNPDGHDSYNQDGRKSESFPSPLRVYAPAPAHPPTHPHEPSGVTPKLSLFRHQSPQPANNKGVNDAESTEKLSADFRQTDRLSADSPPSITPPTPPAIISPPLLKFAWDLLPDHLRGLDVVTPNRAAMLAAMTARQAEPSDVGPEGW